MVIYINGEITQEVANSVRDQLAKSKDPIELHIDSQALVLCGHTTRSAREGTCVKEKDAMNSVPPRYDTVCELRRTARTMTGKGR